MADLDLYLSTVTPDQALAAIQQMADITLNGGAWEPIGHESLDAYCAGQLDYAHRYVMAIVRGDLTPSGEASNG